MLFGSPASKRLAPFLAALALFACKKSNPEAAAAAVAEAVEEPVASAKPAVAPVASAGADAGPVLPAAEVISISNADTTIGFFSDGAAGSHTGTFGKHEGTLTFDPSDITASRVEYVVQIASIHTDSAKLDTHLRSPDFFDVTRLPTATFKSTALKAGAKEGTYSMTGNLDLHGVKKSITFPVRITVTDEMVEAKADFAINRQLFKITFDGAADYGIKDSVSISLRMKAKRPAHGAAPAAPAPAAPVPAAVPSK
jgi:polyisoprenoid-binding protein YceI